MTLSQRTVYIVPTMAGWFFAGTLIVLLITSINYQLNLGYALTFLLAGSGAVSIHLTHRTLRGLTLHMRNPQAVFAGQAAVLDVLLQSTSTYSRHGVALTIYSQDVKPSWIYLDVDAGETTNAQLTFVPERRGWHAAPIIQLESRFPLGLFRAWAYWRPDSKILVYPAQEQPAPALPPTSGSDGQGANSKRSQGIETEGVRGWRRGDAMKSIVWKQAARALATGGELVVRDTSTNARLTLWLDWHDAGGLDTERRLSRLASWVVQADQLGASWGLRLPGVEIAPDAGDQHRLQALERLALWG